MLLCKVFGKANEEYQASLEGCLPGSRHFYQASGTQGGENALSAIQIDYIYYLYICYVLSVLALYF